MQVEGYDARRQAWRVRFGQDLEGWVPEDLVTAGPGPPGAGRLATASLAPAPGLGAAGGEARLPHEDVYRWLDAHSDAIGRALRTLREGGTPAAPYDQLALAER